MTIANTITLAVVTFIAIIAIWEVFRMRSQRPARHARPKWRGQYVKPRLSPDTTVKPNLATSQLETVMSAKFETRRLMSRSEATVFYAVERALRQLNVKGRVMAQVSMGEILRSPDPNAYSAINSKRVDILVISTDGLPLAAVEYQGEAHYQGSAYARDAVKKAALQRAGVAYVEITPQHDDQDIQRDLARVLKARIATPSTEPV
ncbi:MAG: hypothetical protein A2795_03125 [Caulobacterales bacterium RIFCSPHIGHO2_01_FULL_67_30]|nr:MAG: hypothetical protein A2795_03125 [Caulobacterales bacterium RIFCSPHIGHO2_01_FULL_67_30]